MGEYLILNDSDKLKLGKMDDLRYVRFAEVAAMAETQEGQQSPDVKRALADPNALYRFPFPWEDGQSWDDIGQRKMTVPALILAATDITVAHRSVVQCVTAPGGLYQVNVYLPCPYLLTGRGEPEDPITPALCSALPLPSLLLIGERVRQGQARTIFACIYCRVLLSCSSAEIALLQQQNQNQIDAAVLARLIPAE